MVIFTVDQVDAIKALCGDEAQEIIHQAHETARELIRTYLTVQVKTDVVTGNGIEGRGIAKTFASLSFHRVNDTIAQIIVHVVAPAKVG